MRFIIFCFLFCSINSLAAQLSKDSLQSVFRKIDSIFFVRGFNACDISAIEKTLHPEFVFYHDKHGTKSRTEFLTDFKKSICPAQGPKPIRKVDLKSLEVFPLYENDQLYAVIQNGKHAFYLREKGKADVFTSEARFTHLFLLVDGNWLLKESLSFEHLDAKK